MGKRRKVGGGNGVGASERARRASVEAPTPSAREGGRFSARRKGAAVLRLLRGEDLDSVSRELGVTAATLSAWRDDFLAGGEANLKSRQPSPQDEEVHRLKEMIGEMAMRNELLREKIRLMEGGVPLALRRSRG
jgi:transposase